MVAKYIIFQVNTVGHVSFHALVFSQFLKHSQMANPQIGVPVSAGLCTIEGGFDKDVKVSVHGVAHSLNLESQLKDAHIIHQQIIGA